MSSSTSRSDALAVAEETISKGMSWIGGFICSGPEQEERKAGMIEECRMALALIRSESGYTKAGDAVPTPTPGVSVTAPISTPSAEQRSIDAEVYDLAQRMLKRSTRPAVYEAHKLAQAVIDLSEHACTPSHVERRGAIAECMDAAHDAIHDAIPEMGQCERVKATVADALRPLLDSAPSATVDRDAIIEECALLCEGFQIHYSQLGFSENERTAWTLAGQIREMKAGGARATDRGNHG